MSKPVTYSQNGFTLIELILVIVIIGILVGVAVQNGGQVYESARIEETRQELDQIATAVVGNAELHNNGVRSDFGYVGDVGALPLDLSALMANPGGYATWNGPYLSNDFAQDATDYTTDAWGAGYALAGAAISSSGSGSVIVRQLADSESELLYNRVSGNVYGEDGVPPGPVYADSLGILLTHPDGGGSYAIRSTIPGPGGYFSFDSVPIGNHPLEISYSPTDDTVRHFVSVIPGASIYSQFRSSFGFGVGGASGTLHKVTGSDSLVTDCHGFIFWVENSSGVPVDVASLTLSYSAPTAYYRYVIWGGLTVFDENNPSPGSGDVASFTATQTVAAGALVRVVVDFFKSGPAGGPNVDVDGTTFTVTLSDGTSFDVTTGGCP